MRTATENRHHSSHANNRATTYDDHGPTAGGYNPSRVLTIWTYYTVISSVQIIAHYERSTSVLLSSTDVSRGSGVP